MIPSIYLQKFYSRGAGGNQQQSRIERGPQEKNSPADIIAIIKSQMKMLKHTTPDIKNKHNFYKLIFSNLARSVATAGHLGQMIQLKIKNYPIILFFTSFTLYIEKN
jgi:hypothetical protein